MGMNISRLGNLYLQEQQPWTLLKSDPARCGTILNLCVHLVHLLATLLKPYMPQFTRQVSAQLNTKVPGMGVLADGKAGFGPQVLASGHKLGKSTPLFAQISDAQIAAL